MTIASGPTLSVGVTAIGYFVAAWLCACTAATVGRPRGPIRPDDPPILGAGRIWTVAAIILAALGTGRLVGLDSLLTVIGRDLARQQGWYVGRSIVQRGFVVATALIGGLSIAATLVHVRHRGAWALAAAVGVLLLVVFVVMRAASLHRIDLMLDASMAGLRVNHLLELGGIATVALAAIGASRAR